MNVQEIAEFIVGNDLTYQELVTLADQDGFATLMNPNVRKAKIILNEMGKIGGNPIDIFNQYKISLDEYRIPRTLSDRGNIEFGDFIGIPEDRIRTVTRNINIPKPMPLTGESPKSSTFKTVGDFTAIVKPNGEITKVVNVDGEEVELTESMRSLFKPTPIQAVVEQAKILAQSTRKKESNKDVLKSAIPQKEEVVQRTFEMPKEVVDSVTKSVPIKMDMELLNLVNTSPTDLQRRPTTDDIEVRRGPQKEKIKDGPYSYVVNKYPNGRIEPISILNEKGDQILKQDQLTSEMVTNIKNKYYGIQPELLNRSMDDFPDIPRLEEEKTTPTSQSSEAFNPLTQPSVERYEQGGYTNVYRDGQLIGIEQNGKVVVPENKISNPMRTNAQGTYERRKAEEARVAEYGIGMGQGMGGAFGFGQQGEKLDPTIEDLSETLKKDDPSKLQQLGQKVKEGYQGLTKQQKAMGLLMGLDVAGEAVNYFGPARKEARDRIEILEGRRERGQLGVDERQDAETMKYMTRPVRAIAEESEREQQAVMAGMGETRSVADLRRLRESRDAQMTDALSRAGQEVARQQMARKEMERRELNQLQAYQQENLRNLTNRISGAAAQMAGTFGANVAAEADIQKELDPEMMERKVQILVEGGMDEAEARRQVQGKAIERARKRIELNQFFTGVNDSQYPM